MTQKPTHGAITETIIPGFASLVIGAVCWYYQQTLLAWFFLAVGTAGVSTGIFQARLGRNRASNIGVASAQYRTEFMLDKLTERREPYYSGGYCSSTALHFHRE
jgi:hypothetical protein